jgi:hypothetical protein
MDEATSAEIDLVATTAPLGLRITLVNHDNFSLRVHIARQSLVDAIAEVYFNYIQKPVFLHDFAGRITVVKLDQERLKMSVIVA